MTALRLVGYFASVFSMSDARVSLNILLSALSRQPSAVSFQQSALKADC
jgi:hypothetical protein